MKRHHRSTLPRVAATAVALLVLLGGLAAAAATNDAHAAGRDEKLSGVYAGGIRADLVARFEAFRGRPADVVMDFLPGATWSDISVPSWWTDHWKRSAYGKQMVVSVPMLPAEGSASLRDGAGGKYNSYWKTAAERLVTNGVANAVIRPGWEHNGDELGIAFLPWSPPGGISSASELGTKHAVFTEVADAHGVSPQQVCLAWMLRKSPVVIPIPGSSRPETIRDSVKAAELQLTDEEFARLDAR